MLRQFVMQPNEDRRLQIEGRFLVITQATGPIELTIGGTTPITVDEKDRVYLRDSSPNDRAVRIKNVSGGVNTIELHTSDLLVDKRAGVDVKNAITVAEDQRIGIDPGANIVQAIIQNPVRIDPDSNTITIAANQSVGIDPHKNRVQAAVIEPVLLAPNQVIGIDPEQNAVDATLTHPVAIAAGQKVGIDPDHNAVTVPFKAKRYQTLPTLVFTDADPEAVIEKTITSNAQRESLVLTADPLNGDAVWLGGIEGEGTPVFPGDRVFIDGNDPVTLAAKDGHTLYAAEIVVKE